MSTIILIIICIGAIFLGVYLYILFKRTSLLNTIVENYPHQVEALCKIDLKQNHLTPDSKKRILSFNEDDWQDWSKKIHFLKTFSKKYSNVISDYILYYFPYVKESQHYHHQGIIHTKEKRYLTLLNCLTYDDVLKLCLISSEEWSQRDNLLKKAEEICLINPEAISELKKKDTSLSNDDIVRLQKYIESLQLRFNVASAFDSWLPTQKEFNSFVRNLRDEHAETCGCYHYDVEFHKPLSSGKYSSGTIRVWQVFHASFSPYLVEFHSSLSFSMQKNIPEFKERQRYYLDPVYDKIIPYINAVGKDKKLLVIFNNQTSYKWENSTYVYHYKYLKSILKSNDIPFIDFEELHGLLDDFKYDIVFVFDFITTNKDLIYSSKLIIESFSTKIPNIVWYSMIKEFDESEMKKLCEDAIKAQETKNKEEQQKAREEQERKNIALSKSKSVEFIKSQLRRMNKSVRISFFAVTNTLIGSAANASEVKRNLDARPIQNSNDIFVRNNFKKKGYITVLYSSDWGKSWHIFEMEGRYYDIDDVSEFTYEFFKKVGVLSYFIEKDPSAIDYMNSHHFLAH